MGDGIQRLELAAGTCCHDDVRFAGFNALHFLLGDFLGEFIVHEIELPGHAAAAAGIRHLEVSHVGEGFQDSTGLFIDPEMPV